MDSMAIASIPRLRQETHASSILRMSAFLGGGRRARGHPHLRRLWPHNKQ